jgi:hypothetical protein
LEAHKLTANMVNRVPLPEFRPSIIAMPRSRYRVRQESCPYFLIATVNHWLPRFTRPATVNNNPVKRGYVDQPEHWRYSSSAGNYVGQEGLIEMMRVW